MEAVGNRQYASAPAIREPVTALFNGDGVKAERFIALVRSGVRPSIAFKHVARID